MKQLQKKSIFLQNLSRNNCIETKSGRDCQLKLFFKSENKFKPIAHITNDKRTAVFGELRNRTTFCAFSPPVAFRHRCVSHLCKTLACSNEISLVRVGEMASGREKNIKSSFDTRKSATLLIYAVSSL